MFQIFAVSGTSWSAVLNISKFSILFSPRPHIEHAADIIKYSYRGSVTIFHPNHVKAFWSNHTHIGLLSTVYV